MDKKHHVIILGAGASGLSLAWRLASNGVQVDVLESHSQVGGLAGTVREGYYYLDYGPHSFFSEDRAILRTFSISLIILSPLNRERSNSSTRANTLTIH